MCALFCATYPLRASALIMHSSYPRRTRPPDYPFGPTEQEYRAWIDEMQREWGGPFGLGVRAPSLAADKRFSQWWARLLRMSASPAAVTALATMNGEIDVRHILSAIRVPTLLLHGVRDAVIDVGASRYMASQIPGARLVELNGPDHLFWLSDADTILGEIEEFLTGARHAAEPDRVLATVLFTDIVGATEKASALGDRRWRDLLDSHNAVVRRELVRFRGREIKTAGDGFFAAFDGPARAVRCACAISRGIQIPGARGARWPSHRRMRNHGRRHGGDRRPYWRPHRGAGCAGRGARVEHRQGLGRWLRVEISQPRRGYSQGRRGRVESLCGRRIG